MPKNTRTRLIEAARSLFASRGYEGATTAAIAAVAGVAEGTIYRHFKDKKELLLACLEPVISEAMERSLALAADGITLRQLVERMVRERIRILRENQDIYRILFTQGQYQPEIRQLFFKRVLGPRAERIAAIIARFRERGEMIRTPNPAIISVGLQGMLWELLNFNPDAYEIPGSSGKPGGLVDDLVEFLLYGVAGVPASDNPASGVQATGQPNGGASDGQP